MRLRGYESPGAVRASGPPPSARGSGPEICSPRLQPGESGRDPNPARVSGRQRRTCRPLRGLDSMTTSPPPAEAGGYRSEARYRGRAGMLVRLRGYESAPGAQSSVRSQIVQQSIASRFAEVRVLRAPSKPRYHFEHFDPRRRNMSPRTLRDQPASPGGRSKPRQLTVARTYQASTRGRMKAVPSLRLSGEWLARLKFRQGNRVRVVASEGELLITLLD